MKYDIRTNFEKYIYSSGFKINMIAAYTLFFIAASFLALPPKDFFYAMIIAVFLITTALLITTRLAHLAVSSKLSRDIAFWNVNNISREERTDLFKRISKYPIYKAVETFIIFFINGFLAALIFYYRLHIDRIFFIVFISVVVENSYFFAIYTLYRIENQCSPLCQDLVKQGIDFKDKKRPYFISNKLSFIVYIIIPIVLSGCITMLILITGNIPVTVHKGGSFSTQKLSETEQLGYFIKQTIDKKDQLINLTIITAINLVMIIILTNLLEKRISTYTKKMQELLNLIQKNRLSNLNHYPVDLMTETSYSMYLINNSIDVFNKFVEGNASINNELSISTEELTQVAQDQEIQVYNLSANVEEILVTMQNLSYLSKTINTKIEEVINLASQMSNDIESSFTSLNKNLDIMKEITDYNLNTISEISELSKMIKSISDIVNIIDGISDQTKIIAFNSELESNKLKSNESRFYNVASEIRNLADSSIELTRKIKNQIRNVQNSAEELINASQDCMEKINTGNTISSSLEQCFKNIISQANSTAIYSKFTEEYIEKQSTAFHNIAQGLNQVNYSIRTFRDSTEDINNAVSSLNKNSMHISEIKDGFNINQEGENK